jgi:holo-[acyl-carrier protein] synthase
MDFQLPPGGILLGLGCDVIEVARVRGVVERQGDRFLERVFTAEERAYCMTKAHPYNHLAARFAAKEAVSKCFTTGIGAELGWKSASVYHGARQEPLVRLDEAGRALLHRWGGTHILLTLSHTNTVAMAVAALVRAG